ncbi:hypothetical protein B506_05257 [Lactobacillus delbrueckii subsp. jakobsenii ZN7a-9 = DSM 26046]|nr:hypothetical protein B506_05257 [Lactobacillus delbrueckii subsp. jakobsenii ZN7a-9 = DSM 26046]
MSAGLEARISLAVSKKNCRTSSESKPAWWILFFK